jgi:hypothetical protein
VPRKSTEGVEAVLREPLAALSLEQKTRLDQDFRAPQASGP